MCSVRRVCQWRSVQKYTDHQGQRTSLPCGKRQILLLLSLLLLLFKGFQ